MLRDAELPGQARAVASDLRLSVPRLMLPACLSITHDGQGYARRAPARPERAVDHRERPAQPACRADCAVARRHLR